MDRTIAIVWAVVVLFVCTLAAAVVLTVAVDADSTAALVATLLGNLGAIVAVLVNLQRTSVVDGKVTKVSEDTHDLVNGLLDAKVRAGVADVLPEHLIDPDARTQLHRDRERRAQNHDDAHGGAQ